MPAPSVTAAIATAALILAAPACARRMPVRGMVLRIEPGRHTVVVSHQKIPGYMDAMVMPFRVRRAAELDGIEPGAQVEFDLVVRKGTSHIERVRRGARRETRLAPDDAPLPDPPEKLAIGALAPDFALTDQLGRPVRLSGFLGQVRVINFIYTRCPLPEVCPRLSANFARLQRRFQSRPDLVLLSITLDPDYDTPDRLRDYATIWKAAPERWRFLTGAHDEVRRVAGGFGMIYWAEEGLVTHTSQTAVVSRDGRLAALVDGASYQVTQLEHLIEEQLESR
ncbi:MAG: SCO family protein [Bryobacteraceae bacterium]